MRFLLIVGPPLLVAFALAQPANKPTYVRESSRAATIVASLKASGVPALEGPWHVIGPFDYRNFEQSDPPEKEIDLRKTYPGKSGLTAAWQPMKDFTPGKVVNLKRYKV